MIWLDADAPRYPIIDLRGAEYRDYRRRSGFVLLDANGEQISFHRTKSGAPRKRRVQTCSSSTRTNGTVPTKRFC